MRKVSGGERVERILCLFYGIFAYTFLCLKLHVLYLDVDEIYTNSREALS